jgi:ribonuclease HI
MRVAQAQISRNRITYANKCGSVIILKQLRLIKTGGTSAVTAQKAQCPIAIGRVLVHNIRMKPVNIYTDGACSGNQHKDNVGGWGAILEYDGNEKEMFGGEANTTNNRMEMTALLAALRMLKKEDLHIRVFADSAYLLNCFRNKWYVNWRRNDWKTSKKEAVENRDLWEELLKFLDIHTISFFKVKGHVNPNGPDAALRLVYKKFLEQNGADFDYDEFLNATSMNNRADALAGRGIARIREAAGEATENGEFSK